MNRLKTLALALAALGWLAPTGDAAPDRDKDTTGRSAAASSFKSGDDTGDCSTGTAQVDLDANNVRGRLFNTGQLFFNGGNGEYEIPRGSGIISVFASGIWVGGTVDGELRMAAATYAQSGENYEFWPGPLAEDGGPPTRESCQEFDRFWKVSQDDINQYLDSGATTDDLRTWPVAFGAPVIATTANGIDDDNDGLVDEGVNLVDDDGDSIIDERDEQEFVDFTAGPRAGTDYNLEGGDLPDIIGTQSIWWIMNDRGNDHLTTAVPSIGLEVTVQAFAFATSNALNNTTFYKYTLRYKGDSDLQDAYLGLWSDPDLGNFGDDYVGADTTLGLGFVYNSDDLDEGSTGYGERPPALGYDYFQGPLVNDDGIDNDGDGQIDEDEERIDLSAFVYYNNDGSNIGNPSGGEEFYNYLRARLRDGQPITEGFDGTDPNQPETNIMFPANPPEFWSEYDRDPAPGLQPTIPGDRRFLLSSGPFTIRQGSEQEIVFGIVWAQASGGALASLQKLKNDDAIAQGAFDNDFEVPAPPDAPIVETQPIDGGVILTWSNPRTSNNFLNSYDVFNPFSDEAAEDRTYTLEGYEIYQLESPAQSIDQGRKLATLDRINGLTTITDRIIDDATGVELIRVVAEGTDAGLANTFTVRGLVNSQTYFFAVRAYAENAAALVPGGRLYASPVLFGTNLVSAIPSRQGSVDGGTVFQADFEDQLPVTVTQRDVRAPLRAEVVNPAAITGDTYQVRFTNTEPADCTPDENDGTPDDSSDDVLIYNVFNGSGTQVFDGVQFFCRTGTTPISNVVEDGAFVINDRVPIIDGFQLEVAGLTEQDVTLFSSGNEPVCGDLTSLNGLLEDADENITTPIQRVVFENLSGTDDLPLGTVVRFYNGPTEPDTLSFPTYEARNVAYNFVEMIRPGGGAACGGDGNQQGCDQSDGVWVYAENRTYFEEILGVGLNGGANSTGAYHLTSLGAGPEGALDELAPNDFEIRLTGSSFATHYFQEGDIMDEDIGLSTGYEVPFEIWDIGDVQPGEVNDPSDDKRLVPVMFSDAFNNNGETFDDICNGFIYEDPDRINNTPPNPITDRIYGAVPNTSYEDFAAQAAGILFPYVDGAVFEINTSDFAALRGNAEAELSALDDIGVVPNPYRGASEYETSANDRQIRFVNLPSSATIRIFTISGTLVREIVKPASSQTVAFWDLENQRGLPVASGMYLVHIEARNPSGSVIGERVLKLGVVQRRASIDVL